VRVEWILGVIDLDVIGIEMEEESVMAKDVTEGENIQDEEERTKHRTMGRLQ